MASRSPSTIRTWSRRNRNYPRSSPKARDAAPLCRSEVTRLEGDLATLRNRACMIESNTRKAAEVLSVIQASVRENVLCKVCLSPFDDPHVLECGHTFCLKCIYQWFEKQLTLFTQENTHRRLSALQILALREPMLFPALFKKTSQFLKVNPHPVCTCPLCRKTLSREPVRAREIERAVNELRLSIDTNEIPVADGPVELKPARVRRLFESFLLL